MYVCYCRTVTDEVVRDAIARGAHTIADLARECGAGEQCRGCWPGLESQLELIRQVGDAHYLAQQIRE